MAKQTIIQLTDDLDGTEASETIQFSIDGVGYEIDLSERNAGKLRAAIEKFQDAARRMPGRVSLGGSPPASVAARNSAANKTLAQARDENQRIREWANANGYTVSERGRIPQHIVDAYHGRNNAMSVVSAVKGSSRNVTFKHPKSA